VLAQNVEIKGIRPPVFVLGAQVGLGGGPVVWAFFWSV
jgi:hypothetical protein